MTDAMKPVRQRVLQKAADEVIGGHPHDFDRAVCPVVPPPEADRVVVQRDDARIGYGDAMSVAAEIKPGPASVRQKAPWHRRSS